jgi:hypothetical protein
MDIRIDTTLWANEHYRQPHLGFIRIGEHETPSPYTIKPLEWVFNRDRGQWECPTLFGRLCLYNQFPSPMWDLSIPGFTSSHNTRMEALQAAWVWYVNELKLKCLRAASTDEAEAK